MAEIITNQSSIDPIWIGGYSEYEADTFPEILKEYLERYEYKPYDVVMFFRLEKRAITERLVRRWLNGNCYPDFKNQLILAKILNVPCGKIFAAIRNRKDVHNENVKEN